MEGYTKWDCLSTKIAEYDTSVFQFSHDLIEAFADFMDATNEAKVPAVALIETFYAAIADLSQGLIEEQREYEEKGKGKPCLFEDLSIGDYFIRGGAPCLKTSDKYSLDDFNALDLFRDTPIGVPASCSVFHALGELSIACSQLDTKNLLYKKLNTTE